MKLILFSLILTLFVNPGLSQDNPLFVITVDKKQGFIDKTGKIIIEPQLEGAIDFSEDLAVAAGHEPYFKLGYIDLSGKFSIVPQFDNARNFSEGLANVGIGKFEMHGGGNHKWGYIDKSGKCVIKPNFRESRDFSEGLAAVMNDEGKWGYIDKQGTLVVPFRFEDAFSFSEGLACVFFNGLFGFVDQTGKIVIEPRFSMPSEFKEGLAAVKFGNATEKPYKYYGQYVDVVENGELLYIDKTGNTALKFDKNTFKIHDFSEGLAVVEVKKDKKFLEGVIDKTGKFVIEPQSKDYLGNFSEGLAVFGQNKKYGFIDRTGKIVIKPKYSSAQDFHNGLAQVEIGKQISDFKGTEHLGYTPKSGYIDQKGNYIWKPTK